MGKRGRHDREELRYEHEDAMSSHRHLLALTPAPLRTP